ncbi:hypothetical protein [Rubinisphaera margarita]|uniref:hypothetical protein n=1 Tax=Rubinisphaera margarita TaxID=2909586 RepID=UPI001EE9A1F8|nr:hypothetical protein [Rubinisphaera margarita]MCG6155864.1 hypothetical protein [Rubinisphaera margarita]
MRRTLHPLLVMLASLTQQEQVRHVAYLKKENEILRARLPKNIRTTKSERLQLLRPAGSGLLRIRTQQFQTFF